MTISREFLARYGCLLMCLATALVHVADAGAQDSGGVRCKDREGVLLAKSGGVRRPVKAGDAVEAGTELVCLFEADLVSANGAVKFRLLADIGEFGPLPVLDTGVRIEEAGKADLTLTLQRGVVIFENARQAGAATVILKMRGESVEIKLKTPGTKVGIETYGRHPGGAGQILKDDPTMFVYALVGQGEVVASSKENSLSMSAPPGPAMLHWDSVTRKPEIANLDKFPQEFIRNDKEKAQFASMCAAAEKLTAMNSHEAAVALTKSKDPLERRVGVTALGALDDVPHLLDALEDAQHKDVREQAILVLRAWMGRDSGQLKGLRVAMLKHKYTLPQMKAAMHLLIGFDTEDRQRPVVYELLIHSLGHKSVAVRELAHWHLVRLAPAGRDIAFDAAAPEADRQAAVERWRQLIPQGEVPPPPKSDKK